MSETDLQRRIQLAVAVPDVRMFRNNVGEAWQGSNFRIVEGRLVAGSARRVRYGLCSGSSDLIGMKSVIVTPEMIGQRIAIFAAIEVKSEDGSVEPEQHAFVNTITGLGGLAGIARSEGDALHILGVDKKGTHR